MICPKCKSNIADGSESCTGCGYNINNNRNVKKANGKTIVIIAAVIIALVAGGFFVFKGSSGKDHRTDAPVADTPLTKEDIHSSPEVLVKVYFDALSRRDMDTLYGIMAEPVCQQKEGETPNTPDYYKPYLEELDRFYGDNARFSVEIHNVEYGASRDGMYEEEKYIEDVAFVYCDMIITRDGESEKVENHLPCIKIDGKWYTDD